MGWRINARVVGRAALALAAAAPAAAFAADTIGSVANQVNAELGAVPSLMLGAGFLAGVFMLIKGLVAFKDHSEDPRSHPLPKALMLCLAGSLLIAIPTTMDTGIGTLFKGKAGAAKVIDHG